MLDCPLAADLQVIQSFPRDLEMYNYLACEDWLRELRRYELRLTHGKNGTPALRAIEEE